MFNGLMVMFASILAAAISVYFGGAYGDRVALAEAAGLDLYRCNDDQASSVAGDQLDAMKSM